MTTGQLLLKDLPGSINREGTIISGLMANSKQTGAIESAMNQWKKFADASTDTPSVYDQTDTTLDKTIEFFSYLERFYNESDDSLKNRFKAIFYRNGDTSWGNPYDVKNVFREYFPSGEVFLLESTNDMDDSLIVNGDFAESTDNWTIINDVELSIDARFSKHYGVCINTGSISQTVNLEKDHAYFLHFFLNGEVNVEFSVTKDGEKLYWNNKTKEWTNTYSSTQFNSDDWDNKSIYFILNEFDEDQDVTITFKNGNNTYVDYISLFEKQKYCSFTILIHYEGELSSKSLALAEGTIDNPSANIPPNVTVKAENWGYYDNTFMTGPQSGYAKDVYEDLLNYVRSCGVKAYLEFVTKDYIG